MLNISPGNVFDNESAVMNLDSLKERVRNVSVNCTQYRSVEILFSILVVLEILPIEFME